MNPRIRGCAFSLSVCLFLFLSAFSATAVSIAQDWNQKPYTTWSPKDVTQVLTDSPWISLRFFGQGRAGSTHLSEYCRIRLLSAAPIRQAYLRYETFEPDLREKAIDYRDLAEEGTANRAKSLYERFLKQNPNDVRLKESDEYIILSINLTGYMRNITRPTEWWPPRSEYSHADICGENQQLSDCLNNTFLWTDRGQKVRTVRYERPSYDRLGAKFYFPRRLSPGKDWVTLRNKKLHFTTRLNGKTVEATFDLRKLLYKGKLEI
jgi:hypothetical protein